MTNLFGNTQHKVKLKNDIIQACVDNNAEFVINNIAIFNFLEINDFVMAAAMNDNVDVIESIINILDESILNVIFDYDTIVQLHHITAKYDLVNLFNFLIKDFEFYKTYIKYDQLLVIADMYESNKIINSILNKDYLMKHILNDVDIDALPEDVVDRLTNHLNLNDIDELIKYSKFL